LNMGRRLCSSVLSGSRWSAPKKMTIAEELQLDPFTKWIKFGQFPFKLALHVALLVVLCVSAWMLNKATAGSSRALGEMWAALLQPEDREYHSGDPRYDFHHIYYRFSAEHLGHDIERVVGTYFAASRTTVDVLLEPPQVLLPFPRLTVQLDCIDPATGFVVMNCEESMSYTLHNTSQLAETHVNLSDPSLVQRLQYARLHMYFMANNFNMRTFTHRRCLIWNVRAEYNREADALLRATLESYPQKCEDEVWGISVSFYLDLTAALLAIVYQFLVFKAMRRGLRLLKLLRLGYRPSTYVVMESDDEEEEEAVSPRSELSSVSGGEGGAGKRRPKPTRYGAIAPEDGARRGLQRRQSARVVTIRNTLTWRDMRWGDVMKVLDLWVIVSTLGNLAAVVCSCLKMRYYIVSHDHLNGYDAEEEWYAIKLTLGLACAMQWVALLQFLAYFSELYILIRTMSRASPRVMKYMMAVFPIFFGYCFFGIAVFSGYSTRFTTLRDTAITLFAILNGDVVRETFQELLQNAGSSTGMHLVTYVYMYSFCCWFIYAVLMCFVAIVEEAFFAAREYALTTPKSVRNLPPHLISLFAHVKQMKVSDVVGHGSGSNEKRGRGWRFSLRRSHPQERKQ